MDYSDVLDRFEDFLYLLPDRTLSLLLKEKPDSSLDTSVIKSIIDRVIRLGFEVLFIKAQPSTFEAIKQSIPNTDEIDSEEDLKQVMINHCVSKGIEVFLDSNMDIMNEIHKDLEIKGDNTTAKLIGLEIVLCGMEELLALLTNNQLADLIEKYFEPCM